jgi:MtN3 and saliva related transmembrane protein
MTLSTAHTETRFNMTSIDTLGLVAAFCTSMSFLPQALKVIKTGDTRSLSLGMYSLFTFGVALWLLYGLFKNDLAVTAANCLTLLLAATILVTKIRNDVLRNVDAPKQKE